MIRSSFLFCVLALGLSTAIAATPPNIVVSINPIHSLVSGIMQGVAEPSLLLGNAQSPHQYSLKPSDAFKLHKSDLVIWVGPEVEGFLVRSLKSRQKPVFELLSSSQIMTLPARHIHQHDEHESEHTNESSRSKDGHIWLDPTNAQTIVQAIAERLSNLDPKNQPIYSRNAQQLIQRLEQLDQQLRDQLAAFKETPFILFHDAYQYFENHYNLHSAAWVAVNPDRAPGAKRVLEIREIIKTQGAKCVFSEPQFQSRIIDVLLENTAAQMGELDPIGIDIPPGPEAYFILLNRITDNLVNCLQQ